jgi:hypothetical protein
MKAGRRTLALVGWETHVETVVFARTARCGAVNCADGIEVELIDGQ